MRRGGERCSDGGTTIALGEQRGPIAQYARITTPQPITLRSPGFGLAMVAVSAGRGNGKRQGCAGSMYESMSSDV